MIHASSAFPSHWVLILEVLLVAAALAVVALGERTPLFSLLDRSGRVLLRGLRLGGRRPGLSLTVLGAMTFLAMALLTLVQGPPQPRVVDEFSYLLAADTFASGRVAVEPHPQAAHFAANHVLLSPTYASKYPPAQGLILAVGEILGSPVVGLWLSATLLTVAVGWALLAWMPAPWALLAAAVVAIRLGVGSYWNQSYWGGSVAAIGGALLLGGLRRDLRRTSFGATVAMVGGLSILANSRPYEGLLVALPGAAVLLWRLARGRLSPHPLLQVVLPTVGLGLLLLVSMATYNQHVTGHWRELPHQVYDRTHDEVPVFAWEHREDEPDLPTGIFGWRKPRSSGLNRLATTLLFFAGLPLLLPMLLSPATVDSTWSRLATASFLVVALGHFIIYPWWVHYSAPALTALLIPALRGQRYLLRARWRGREVGRALLAAGLGIQLVLFLFQIPAQRADSTDPSAQRARLQEHFENEPGKHLLLVRYPPGWSADWTYNPAFIDAAKVVWATDLGEGRNAGLLDYYADRTVWSIDADMGATDPTPRLLRRPTAG